MILTGMIFQYDSTRASGIVMFSNGETKEFTQNDWADALTPASIGLKVSYDNAIEPVQIKAFDEEKSKELEKEAIDNLEEFTDIDACIKSFTSTEYKLIKDEETEGTRTITLRHYAMGDSKEALITKVGSKITVTHTLNGKAVILSQ
ncbi:MAG: hypothetical protein Q9M32_06515 [Sulfurimonas sp.]|nr:hypothetical protein [Sulfurimonas sp.]MDQ7062362.1 hypothetical protein [Sulfurimonas sp.]